MKFQASRETAPPPSSRLTPETSRPQPQDRPSQPTRHLNSAPDISKSPFAKWPVSGERGEKKNRRRGIGPTRRPFTTHAAGRCRLETRSESRSHRRGKRQQEQAPPCEQPLLAEEDERRDQRQENRPRERGTRPAGQPPGSPVQRCPGEETLYTHVSSIRGVP